MCVWADWTQMQIIANALGTVLLIRDTSANFSLKLLPSGARRLDLWPIESEELPQASGKVHSHSNDGSNSTQAVPPLYYLHLLRVDSCHYNLFKHGELALFTRAQCLTTTLASMFELPEDADADK